ncbi:MAG: YhfC family intramembrane metalloprotease [Clostridiales bacterium]|jgi:uncharacterized membrane protein YhfC|nr:YhfC family intramembrane metalloprotease [Clostridiales bacterium]
MYNLSCVFSVICSVILPIGMAVLFCVRNKNSWKPILFGALTFVVFQVFIRIPILEYAMSETEWFIIMSSTQPFLYALFLGSTAGLVEEGGRFLVMSQLMKKQRSTLDAIAFGVGHGGIEAILFVGIKAVGLLLSPIEQAAPSEVFAAGAERLSAIAMQITFSVMVMKSVRERKYIWLLLPFIIHTCVNLGAALAISGVNIWIIEVSFLLAAALMVWFVVKEYRKEKPDPRQTEA